MSKITKSSLLRTLLTIGLVISILPTAAAEAAGAIYRVKENGSTSGTCGNTWDSSCSLQYALNLAQAGDQVWVARGTYKPTASADRAVSFNLKSGVAVYGGFAGTETLLSQRDPVANVSVLSGDIGTPGVPTDNSYHVINAAGIGNNTILDGFKISNGNANGASPHDMGGGIYCYSCTAAFSNLIFRNNSSSYQGGAIFIKASTITLDNVTFAANSSGKFGGALLNHTSNLTLSNATFTDNTAGERGGGLYNYGSTATLTNVSFSGNNAALLGGGMNNSSSNVQLTGGAFTNNAAGTSGGGIYFAAGNLTLANVTFTGNSAKGGGGLLSSSNSVTSITNALFEDNYAQERGGGVYFYDSAGTITNVTFKNNVAEQHGGAMFNSASDPVVSDSTFTGNSSQLYGGAIDNNTSSPTLTNVQITGNSAIRGGGIYNWEYSSGTLTNVTIKENSATHRGGGMYVVDYCDLTFTDVVFERNTSVGEGGGIFVSNSHPVLTRVRFTGNSSANFGGGMYNSYTHATLNDVIFDGNSAISGGGLNNNNSDPALTNNTFTDNSASERGGGLYNYSSDPVLVNVTFKGNTAGTYGGGISNSGGTLQMNHSTLADNSAGIFGGGMWLDETNININNSIFWENFAATSGPQIYSNHSGMPIVDTSIIQNDCPSGAVCTNILTGDPTLGTLGDHGGFTPTIPLLPGSAAIDSGNSATCAPTDQRGISRPQGIRCDIGAYEADEIGLIKTSPANQAVLVEDTLTLRWTPSNGLGSYEVCADTTDNGSCDTGWLAAGSTTNHSLTASTLTPGSTYYWQVRALGGADWYYADNGIWWSFTLNEISPRIDQKLTTSKVSFDWSDIPGAVAYKIQLSSKPDFSTVLFNIKSPTSTYTYATALKYNTAYYWRVRPIFSNSKGSWSSAYRFYSMNALSAPALDSPRHKDYVTSQFTLFWQGVENGAAYKVVIATDASFSNKVGFEKTAELSANFTLPAGKYFWRVRAFDASGIKSAWSETRKFFVEATP